MNVKKNILQFTPYYPPHIGGVENVVEGIFSKWTHGKTSINSGNKGQQGNVYNENIENQNISLYPSFDIVDNFPFPGLWTKIFWKNLSSHKNNIEKGEGKNYVITHTRFFLSSFVGGVFARRFLPSQEGYRVKWIHIEHGSDYVQLSSGFKNKVAYLYDRIFGKWIFKNADTVLAISETSKEFIEKEFGREDVEVWYRGIEFPSITDSSTLQKQFPGKKIIGYIGRLYKWKNVESLCRGYLTLPKEVRNETQLVIIGGGEDLVKLGNLYENKGIFFTGEKSFEESFALQSEFDIHVHPSSPGGGLATTLLQAMHHGSIIVATPYEGAREVIENGMNGYLLSDDSTKSITQGILLALDNLDKRESFKEKNKHILAENFSWEKNIEKLYNFL